MEKNTKQVVQEVYNSYKGLIDIDTINRMIKISGNKDLGEISKKTITNIAKWALNGSSNKEIASNLELTDSQFKVLVSICPVLMYVMQSSRELADIVITGALFDTAIGGKVIRKQQLVKIKDYTEDGRVIGEHLEKEWVAEELPPNPLLLKFLAEHKLSEKFGKDKNDKDQEVVSIVNGLDDKDLELMKEQLEDYERNQEQN